MNHGTPKWEVLVSAPYLLPVLEDYRPIFEEHGITVRSAPVTERLDEVELLALVPHVDGIICGDDRLTKQVFQAAPRLKVVSKWGTGIDSIDVQAAESMGVRVFNTPNAFTDPVADTVMGYLLLFARGLPWLDRDMRAGHWRKRTAVSLSECSLGIVGMGYIGKAVAHRAVSFGLTVYANDASELPENLVRDRIVTPTTLNELLEASDFISLNCDLNPSSFHLIGENELRRMKNTAYLINTSRGSIVDETALVNALDQGWISGAALDVFEDEPLAPTSQLLTFDNCFLAPHNANSSPKAWKRVHEITINNLIVGLTGNR